MEIKQEKKEETREENEERWTKHAEEWLVGRKIVRVQYMTDKNANEAMWYSRPIILVLDDGTIICPQSDDEGNNGGALMCETKDGKMIGKEFPTDWTILPVLDVKESA